MNIRDYSILYLDKSNAFITVLHFAKIYRMVFVLQGLQVIYYTPTHIAITLSVCPSVHTFVTDISASTGRNDFIFDIWLWHGDL